VQGDVVAPLLREATMNDKIATAFLATLAGAIAIGILYIAFVPIPELAARNPRDAAEAERIKATVACIEQSGAAKERDYKLAGHKAAKCAEQIR
jgi:flagellar motor component MotA